MKSYISRKVRWASAEHGPDFLSTFDQATAICITPREHGAVCASKAFLTTVAVDQPASGENVRTSALLSRKMPWGRVRWLCDMVKVVGADGPR